MLRLIGPRSYAALAALVVLAMALPMLATTGADVAAQGAGGAGEKPNVVLIVMDDLRAEDLRAMPNVRRLLVDQGTSFDRAYVTDPICCPSRASILRGQYVHNHGVRTIAGAFPTFRRSGEESTVATWLDDIGYRTGLVGKYFVSYPDGAPETYVPPGWDGWVGDHLGDYFNYKLSVNGQVVRYLDKARVYRTDVEARFARTFLEGAAGADPFFLYVTPKAPHGSATPAPRHLRSPVPEAKAPRVPSFNEADVADKPAYVRGIPRFNGRRVGALDAWHVARQRTLISADQMVASLVGTLQQTGELNNTYVIFSSDNGYLLGEHRIEGKNVPYEASIRVPLVVRGPGVKPGRTDDRLVTLADLAPTIADLTGAGAPGFVDGRSLRPALEGSDPPRRAAVLVEYVDQHNVGPGGGVAEARFPLPPSWSAVRTVDRLYVEYAGGDREYYDLRTDRYQLTNLAKSTDATIQADIAVLATRLNELRRCKANGCRAAEDAPLVFSEPGLAAASRDQPAAAGAADTESGRLEGARSGAEERDRRAANDERSRREPARDRRPADGRGAGGRAPIDDAEGGPRDEERPPSRRAPTDRDGEQRR